LADEADWWAFYMVALSFWIMNSVWQSMTFFLFSRGDCIFSK